MAETDKLTNVQREVMLHLAKGLSVSEVAVCLGRSPKSVDSHKYRLMRTLGVHDRLELARLALREELVKVDDVVISDQSLESLSDRQREILCLVARGFRVRDIAEKLGISERSADAHKTKAMHRLHIHDRIGVLFYAIQQGLIELEWRDTDSGTSESTSSSTDQGGHRRPLSDVDGSSAL
jgi:DNA-binding NarL/FixJ family response regulator